MMSDDTYPAETIVEPAVEPGTDADDTEATDDNDGDAGDAGSDE